MGITGLLPLLKSIHKPCNLKKFAGQTIGVDAYGWLHRGTVACSMELAMGKPTRKFVDFAMQRVRMLQHFGVTPFLVFDGDYLPSKAATEADRAKKREDSKKHGIELFNAGKTSQAYLELQKAVDVTPEMARQLIDELKATGVQYLVAPYEADAQLVYLERKGIIHGILSEDSDLLVFGAKCLLTKLDQYGNCIEINKDDFCAVREINLTGWSDTEFRAMAILSGCDYLASINNMGLKTAYRMVRKYKTVEKVLQMLSFDGKYYVPKGYLEAFYQAELTFLHQRVYCPLSNKVVCHTEPVNTVDGEEKMPFIGAYVEPTVAIQVAIGDLNPMTKKPIVVEEYHDTLARRNQWGASRGKLQRAVTSDGLKKGVSIEQFFRPKRIPLAEMDANCFTPSPSQQNALLRNTGSWETSPILPRPYLHHSTSASESQLPSSTIRSSGSQVGRSLPWSISVSASRPPKRARLCDDSTTLSALAKDDAVLGCSRFFNSPTTDPSPSIGRSKATRSKKDDTYLYSDDSIEQAMLDLPDYDGWQMPKSKSTKITIFEEAQEDHTNFVRDAATEVLESQSTAVAATISQISIPGSTQEASIAGAIEAPPTSVQRTAHSSAEALSSRFTFTPVAAATQRNVACKPTPPSSMKSSRIPIPTKASVATSLTTMASKSKTKSNILTPLQSLGAKALYRFRAPDSPPYTPIAPSTRSIVVFKPGFKEGKSVMPFPEVVDPSALHTSLSPADIPLPAADYTEETVLAADFDIVSGKGSEDLIVHDSQDDEDEDVPSPADVKASNFDLTKFTFIA